MYVVDFDDLCDEFDPYLSLMALKNSYPSFKCTLFAIPSRCSPELLSKYRAHDWIELGVHGYHHASQECVVWGYDETIGKLEEMERLGWDKLFKAPNWQMNHEVYRALVDRGWKVADHMTFAYRSEELTVDRYTFNLPHNQGFHGHTWEVAGNGPNAWHIEKRDDYAFVSEACKPINWQWQYYGEEQDANASWSTESMFGKASALGATNLLQVQDLPKDGLIVDFGGNDGFVPNAIREAGWSNIWSVEACPRRSAASHYQYNIPTICADLQHIPVDDEAFDWGYCSHTVEHIEDLDKAWSEMQRVVKNGILVVAPVETEKEFNDNPAHVRRHSVAEWCDLLGMEMLMNREDKEVVGIWRK